MFQLLRSTYPKTGIATIIIIVVSSFLLVNTVMAKSTLNVLLKNFKVAYLHEFNNSKKMLRLKSINSPVSRSVILVSKIAIVDKTWPCFESLFANFKHRNELEIFVNYYSQTKSMFRAVNKWGDKLYAEKIDRKIIMEASDDLIEGLMSCSGVKAFIRPLEYPIGKPRKNIEAKDTNLNLAIKKYHSNKSISQCDRMALHYLKLRVIAANCSYNKHNKLKTDKILSKHGLYNIEKKCNYIFVSDKKLRRELVPSDLLNASAPIQDDCELFNKQVLEFTRRY